MASAEVMAEFRDRNDGGPPTTTNSLFSKFGRSPSRKHKPRPSSESIDTVAAATIKASKVRARPPVQRGTTAPDGQLSLNTITQGVESLPRKGSEGALLASAQSGESHNNMYAVPSLGASDLGPQYKFVQSDVPKVPPINGAIAYNPSVAVSLANPNTLFQHIHDVSSKRMATLDYMRKAHEGRTFWFNTIKFSHVDISKLPSYSPNRLSRRATNYMILGMSIPTVIDVHPPPHPTNTAAQNAAIAQEYLRGLNALLVEFETYQQMHPPDGSTASSLSRARLPQMFKRSSTRPRKSSGAIGAELTPSISAPAMPEPGSSHAHQTSLDGANTASGFSSSSTQLPLPNATAPGAASFPTTSAYPLPGPHDAPNSTLTPNEGPYNYLITPPLPFAPDFYTVFATLSEVLIDVYQRLLQLLSGPDTCTPNLSEMFTKVDARIRKVMVGGILKEFETSSRDNAKKELMSVQKVVLGGLMGT